MLENRKWSFDLKEEKAFRGLWDNTLSMVSVDKFRFQLDCFILRAQ